ncbi:hypothetical protein H6G76_18180 [Nostoc sp. FACHB-152]|uniref:hypothetical protein n=1 Tax=unclassified Nostoc TaxID=2593658 RepID=UPI0016839388|nr:MULTISPECIES: hypothetical protein [unclassified Nostoc]MBD2449047.1 hypothetical protein [Nostoc sp. FACHB-152]MBD2471049.1 hypothetical protein [Nostoc sp. FACHB-145]
MAKNTDFTNFANLRPNYFPGQYLLEDDFELQHKYLSDRQLYHHQSLHLPGIIEGLEVVVIQNSKSVQIKSGAAIDSNGNLIILKEDTTFSDFKNLTDGELYIQYFQSQQNQQQKDVADSYTRWVEKPVFGFASSSPQNSIKLAKLSIKDTITIDATLREYSGLSLPNSDSKALTLRSGGNANPNLAVLTGSLKIDGDLTANGTGKSTYAGSVIVNGNIGIGTTDPGNYKLNVQGDQYNSGSLTINGNITGKNLSLAADNNKRGTLFLATPGDYNHALYNNLSNVDNEGIWDGAKWNVLSGLNIRVGSGNSKTTALYINNTGNVGIGINNPGDYKLNVQGNQYIKGSLTIQDGKVNLNGNQQIVFTDTDTSNNLKLQLWTGYGLGINNSTLFYTANGNHSWRDNQNNERMLLTTGADGGLTVKGTGTSSFAGNLTVNGSVKFGYESTISNFGTAMMSGFYQNGGQEITGDVPDTSHGWTHLITTRHSNTDNNHQLQIAATYQNNDRLFFRKIQFSTNDVSNPAWNEVATRDSNQFTGNQGIAGNLTVNGTFQYNGFTDADQDEWPKFTWYRDTSKNWDEGLIKHGSSRGIFKKAGYGIHLHQSREFGLWSTGWDALFAVEGQTGNTYIKGALLGTAGDSNGAVLREMFGTAKIAFDYTGSIDIYCDTGKGFVKVKTFVIDHPLDQSKYLIHGTLEGPEASVFYRGSSQLVNGKAEINLPDYFEALTHKEGRTIVLTNIDGFDKLMVKKIGQDKIVQGKFYVVSDNPESSQEFDWEVKAIRKDVAPLVVEPNKTDYEVTGHGPYTYAIAKNSTLSS